MKLEVTSLEVDKLETEVTVLLFFSDERPLRGAAGLVDWRMNGSISRLLEAGQISGKRGEAILIAPQGRIKGQKILMVGLGASSHFEKEDIERAAADFTQRVIRLRASTVAIAIPSRRFTSLDAGQSAVTLIRGVKNSGQNTNHLHATLLAEKEDLDAVNEWIKKTADH